ncbi:hypothetical protein GQ53DRAFT_166657 [Thozetella sp. PMI_491]|nr:hypothetical protein GQ53DRAFT_166657 [Thozetella sp. PMI_491]
MKALSKPFDRPATSEGKLAFHCRSVDAIMPQRRRAAKSRSRSELQRPHAHHPSPDLQLRRRHCTLRPFLGCAASIDKKASPKGRVSSTTPPHVSELAIVFLSGLSTVPRLRRTAGEGSGPRFRCSLQPQTDLTNGHGWERRPREIQSGVAPAFRR